jgi:DNA-binding MarR family transcriptional regulator
MPTYIQLVGMSSVLPYPWAMAAEDHERWMGAWLALLRTHARLWDQLEAQMRREHGLTIARYDVLAHLDSAGGRLRLSDLASSIVLSPSGLSKLLDRMEASELIRREPDPSDARSTFAAITRKGRALVKKARPSHHELLQQRFGDALDDDDVADLTRIMGRISESISATETAP